MTFGIKTLFLLMTSVAVALYLLVSAPAEVAAPLLVMSHVLVGGLLIACIVYGSGGARAFSIGAMIPGGATLLALTFTLSVWFVAGAWEVNNFEELLNFLREWAFMVRVWSAACWILCPLAGLVTLEVRRALQAGQRSGERPLASGKNSANLPNER